MNQFVYLDNNATTKIDTNIRNKIQPYLDLQFGNPSSIYQHGVRIKEEIIDARESCANLLNCDYKNIIFTSGGSESNCSVFHSAIEQYPNKKKIITTKVEHTSILEYCNLLQKKGYKIVYLDVDENCQIGIDNLLSEVDDETCLVSIQLANNEVGAILLNEEIVEKIKALKKKFDFVFHVDAVQGLGKLKIDVDKIKADFISFSGHKIHCPKGIGLLYIKEPEKYTPLIAGHQEFGLRGGTENVIGIVAIGESCKDILEHFEEKHSTLVRLHKYLESKLHEIAGLTINCEKVERIPNTTSITFDNIDGNQLLFKLNQRGICVSTGSACNSESSELSHVLTSMKIKNPQNTIRVSIDENTSNSQIEYFIKNLKEILKGE